MRTFTLFICFLLLIPFLAQAETKIASGYFERPVSCPLRFSKLSHLRDQVQTLVASLGSGCSQNGQQALNQLNTSVANLEGIATSWSTFQGTDEGAQRAQLAKNASQVLGSLNIITSNNACFYDIRSRGALPVISDIVMSLSQLGLLIPTVTSTIVATGGYVVGSGLKIIHQLVKKKFNWNKPEERRAFLQLNCAFFDNRRTMEEMGLFNPETRTFREEVLVNLKKERLELIKLQRQYEADALKIESELDLHIFSIPGARESGVNPLLKRKLDELSAVLATKPVDYPMKWQQVSNLAQLVPIIFPMLEELKLDRFDAEAVRLLINNINTLRPELAQGGKAWTSTIDEYDIWYRGPIVAFTSQISQAMAKKLLLIEAVGSASNPETAKSISNMRGQLKETRAMEWGASQRLLSVEARITSLEESDHGYLFSHDDEGKSDAVEILDYYKKLQTSILGKEGKGYLKNSLERTDEMIESLNKQIKVFDAAESQREKCAAAEKLRFAWAQYRYKVQEAFDFVATNLDLYRSSFKTGKEKQKRARRFVMEQISSVDELSTDPTPPAETVGHHMNSVKLFMEGVEKRLQDSACF